MRPNGELQGQARRLVRAAGADPAGGRVLRLRHARRRSETRRADATLEAGVRAAASGVRGPARRGHRDRPRSSRRSRRSRRPCAPTTGPRSRGSCRRGRRSRPPCAPCRSSARAGCSGRCSTYLPIRAHAARRALGRRSARRDELVAVRGGRIVAGPRRGDAARAPAGRAGRVTVDGRAYRGLLTGSLGAPRGLELAALTPQSAIDAAAHSAERASSPRSPRRSSLFAIATLPPRPVGRRDAAPARRRGGRDRARASSPNASRFAATTSSRSSARAFNGMAAQLEQRLSELQAERARVQEAVARFGEALAATHDTEQLVRVVVESAVEATGAAGGVVLGPDGELARAGDPDAGAERIALPLRVGTSDFGLLVLTGDAFTPSEVETATSLAAQVVVALENARLHRVVERQAMLRQPHRAREPAQPRGDAARGGRARRALRRLDVGGARRPRRLQAGERPLRSRRRRRGVEGVRRGVARDRARERHRRPLGRRGVRARAAAARTSTGGSTSPSAHARRDRRADRGVAGRRASSTRHGKLRRRVVSPTGETPKICSPRRTRRSTKPSAKGAIASSGRSSPLRKRSSKLRNGREMASEQEEFMAVDTPSMFAQVIQDHLELKRRNAALEHEMPLERYMTAIRSRTTRSSRRRSRRGSRTRWRASPASRARRRRSTGRRPTTRSSTRRAEPVIVDPDATQEALPPEALDPDQPSDENLWSRSRDFDWGD